MWRISEAKIFLRTINPVLALLGGEDFKSADGNASSSSKPQHLGKQDYLEWGQRISSSRADCSAKTRIKLTSRSEC
ncbi:hypothetical protein RRG08_054387 [Elysia crispata]|uniref:Uncharacterized protein n=1 Tax=Elysia crispata TaxID=231223 RepID=A0AAE1E9I8_9GAST|nr:hypothetical protein RRG08_054387 [Elysia crispata]